MESRHVAVGYEIAQRRLAALGHRLGDQPGGGGLGLGEPLTRRGIALRRLLPALGGKDQARLVAFRQLHRRLALAFGPHHRGAAFALGGHLQVHGADQILGRLDLAQFDAADLHPPGRGGAVQDHQQLGVDALA